jgi:hypothetical protein
MGWCSVDSSGGLTDLGGEPHPGGGGACREGNGLAFN